MIASKLEKNPLLQNSDKEIYTSLKDEVNISNNSTSRVIESSSYPSWWGWVVVISSFYCIAILDGVGYTTGVMLDSLLSDLGGDRARISLVGSLQVGVYCLSGPLVGKLVTTHGCRPVCVSGSILAALGLLAASFAPSLSILIWSYSVVTGRVGFEGQFLP